MKPKEIKEIRDARVYQEYDVRKIKLYVLLKGLWKIKSVETIDFIGLQNIFKKR